MSLTSAFLCTCAYLLQSTRQPSRVIQIFMSYDMMILNVKIWYDKKYSPTHFVLVLTSKIPDSLGLKQTQHRYNIQNSSDFTIFRRFWSELLFFHIGRNHQTGNKNNSSLTLLTIEIQIYYLYTWNLQSCSEAVFLHWITFLAAACHLTYV